MDKLTMDVNELISKACICNDGDVDDDVYVDESDGGLLHCVKCGGRRETWLSVSGGAPIRMPCTCRCMEENTKRERDEKAITELRGRCLPETLHSCRFDGPGIDSTETTAICRNYVANWEKARSEGVGLCLWGCVGSGKSTCAALVANALIDRQIAVSYRKSAEIVGGLLSRTVDNDEYVNALCRPPLLIVDDLGSEGDGAAAQSVLTGALDKRFECGKPLVITTNISLDGLKHPKTPLTARLYDRILQHCIPVVCVGESRRKAAAKNMLSEWAGILKPGEGD